MIPVLEWAKTVRALDRAATAIGDMKIETEAMMSPSVADFPCLELSSTP
jgi:hypothetical protein